MLTQEAIVKHHTRMTTISAAIPYGASVIFAAIAAALIVYAPESRTTAANIVAGALLLLAAGIAGFTRLKAKAPGVDIEAGRQDSN